MVERAKIKEQYWVTKGTKETGVACEPEQHQEIEVPMLHRLRNQDLTRGPNIYFGASISFEKLLIEEM
ncbi:uncharacterized protein G2W53_014642 [Senna tora]|uniref:Uncharacterized protein n=1 Tax=Senna tora TaxID=362788 RepID=A0A834WU35_9FABA|nr:uncharacterized protein G2W53_014642 [Senna tora]